MVLVGISRNSEDRHFLETTSYYFKQELIILTNMFLASSKINHTRIPYIFCEVGLFVVGLNPGQYINLSMGWQPGCLIA